MRLPEPGPAPGVYDLKVTPELLAGASGKLTAQAEAIAGARSRLASVLDGCGGMGGNDPDGIRFAARYDPAAAQLMRTLSAAVNSLWGMASGLTATANNYLQAEQHSTAGASRAEPGRYAMPGRVPAGPGTLAPARGAGSPGLPPPLDRYWPNGHQDRLRRAAQAYTDAATALAGVHDECTAIIGSITDSNSAASLEAMREFYGDIWSTASGGGRAPLSSCHHACQGLAALCGNYASLLDEVHSAMLRRLAEAGGAVAITDIVGGIADFFTGGLLTEVVGGLDAVEVEDILGPLANQFGDEADAEINAGGTASLEGELETAEQSAPDVETAEADTVSADDVEEDELETDGGDQGNGGPPVVDLDEIPEPGPEPWDSSGHGNDGDPARVADEIARHTGEDGHEHDIEGVSDEELPEYVEDIIRQPGYRLDDTKEGYHRMAWYDPDKEVMVIRNGNGGSVFHIGNWHKFITFVLDNR